MYFCITLTMDDFGLVPRSVAELGSFVTFPKEDLSGLQNKEERKSELGNAENFSNESTIVP